MALTVGELNAIMTVDDRAVDPALRRTEQAIRTAGQTMGDDAQRAGQTAGQQLGDGVVRGSDGRLRDLRGRFVQAGRDAGQGLGDGVRQGSRDVDDAAGDAGDDASDSFIQRMRGRATDGMGELGGNLREIFLTRLGPAALGAVVGGMLMAGISDAMDQQQLTGRLAAQLGKTPAEAQRYGKIAGQLYATAVTEDFEGATEVIGAVMRAGIMPETATNKQIQSISANVSDLAKTFELDLGQTANAVGQMIKTGLAKDGKQAVDALTRGLQKMGPRADDIADTFNEYSTIFRQMGIDATTATGLLSQGMKAGARDTDVVADSLKEFVLITQGGGKQVDAAFKSIGLNGKDMQKAFIEGGPKARKALDQVFDGLRKMKNGTERNNTALTLFGTKSEDTQKALMALDPSSATDALGQVGGAADKMGNALRDNASTKVEAFKRGIQQGVVDFLGNTVVPALTTFRDKGRSLIGGVWDEAGKGNEQAADRVVAFFPILYQRLVDKGKELIPRLGGMVSNAFQGLAQWIMSNPEQALKLTMIAAGIIAGILTLPVLVAASVVAAATTMSVSFTTGLINSFNEQLPKWWEYFKNWHVQKAQEAAGILVPLGLAIANWFSGLWSKYIAGPVSRGYNSFIAFHRALPGRTVGALAALGGAIAGVASRAWSSFLAAAQRKGSQFLAWVRGLPGRTVGAVGGMGSLLTGKGRNVVEGLWAGIASMGGWLKSKLYSWARSSIPGPIAKALGINSPSKVTKAQGRWIARGLVDGMTGSTKQIRAASTKLADIVSDSLRKGSKKSRALKLISSDTKKLTKLANQRDRIGARIKTAQKKLDGLIKDRDKLAASVKQGVLDSADITKQDTGGWPQTAETILAGLQADRAAAERFARNLATLRKKGVRADLIAQIAQAGVDQGSSAAAALAAATSGQIKQINSEQSKLVTAAGQAGNSAGDAMYGAGINAARGLIKGLQSQQKAIDNQMLKIARSMAKSIRKALGIKSPSRVMALVGQYTGQGLIKGVEGQRAAVNRSMASLVETPAPGSWDMASARARSAASQKVVLELRSSGSGEDDYLLGRVRRGIRKKGGGDVDLVLAGRRSG
ncbi:phage tail tape measure protein [Streptomyces arenae]|uniref:phage tail tape measure protein n=1 Tax=Streptomyces arenae TaxID=29301 RepID=UPI00265A5C80|nr:phage tail tape measure protein [Streptomyces arenae]MCG7203950.1 phage tail tape measure protein [Streptomyces arenae]